MLCTVVPGNDALKPAKLQRHLRVEFLSRNNQNLFDERKLENFIEAVI